MPPIREEGVSLQPATLGPLQPLFVHESHLSISSLSREPPKINMAYGRALPSSLIMIANKISSKNDPRPHPHPPVDKAPGRQVFALNSYDMDQLKDRAHLLQIGGLVPLHELDLVLQPRSGRHGREGEAALLSETIPDEHHSGRIRH